MVFCRINRSITDSNQIVDMDALLKEVARTFYLSLTYLPRAIRQPMALAYLLARLSDTIADAQNVPIDLRRDLLQSLRCCVEQPYDEGLLSHLCHHALACTPYFSGADLTLLGSGKALFSVLRQQPERIQALIQQVLLLIFTGQMVDLDYFDRSSEIVHFKTAQDLDQYLYWVAGSVGEFWTRLCFACIPQYSSQSLEKLLPKAVNFGKALQLTNILRDMRHDLAQGRCYLPFSEFEHGDPQDNPEQFMCKLMHSHPTIIQDWRTKTLQYLQDAKDYTDCIKNRRVRFSTLVPLDLAHKTLVAWPEKISRKSVYATLLRALFHSYLRNPRVVVL